jgi:uncharacterized protein (DUF924 family)
MNEAYYSEYSSASLVTNHHSAFRWPEVASYINDNFGVQSTPDLKLDVTYMALFRTFFLMSSLTSIPRIVYPTARHSLHLSSHRRAMSTYKLDASIFNPTLYKNLTDIWLPGVDFRGEELDVSVMKRWFAGSADERAAFDGTCRENFAHALEAIGPEQIPEPTAQPFLDEIERIRKNEDDAQAAWAALSLALLLDQIPRNIYRTDEGLRKVYNHYDKMSYALSRTLLSSHGPIPRVDLHPQWRNSAAHRMWFYMPLMHSEDLEAHNLLDGILAEAIKEAQQLEGHQGTKTFLEKTIESEASHRAILDKFGRYPHRNGALGRTSTEEEKKFMEDGGETFGVTQEKKKSTE